MMLYSNINGSPNGWEILFDFFVIGYTVSNQLDVNTVTAAENNNTRHFFSD
jgi:hypothetical protein